VPSTLTGVGASATQSTSPTASAPADGDSLAASTVQTPIQTILNNTSNGVPVSIGLNFAGGMQFALPAQIKVAFNHDALSHLL